METSKQECIIFNVLFGRPPAVTFSWPILQTREKSVFVKTPGGAIWLPRQFCDRLVAAPQWAGEIISQLRELTESERPVQILKVQQPAQLGKNVRATVETRVPAFGERVAQSRKRAVWLWASVIHGEPPHAWAPFWAVQRAVAEAREYNDQSWKGRPGAGTARYKYDEELPVPKEDWPGLSCIQAEFDAAKP